MIEMKVLKDREEWLQNRKNGLGGSEISAVLGLNPYLDNVTLWEYKTGRKQPEDISDKPYVKYGTQAEMHLRGLFRLDYPQYQVEYVDNNSFKNDKYPWALASLDGWLLEEEGTTFVEVDDGESAKKILSPVGRFGILEIKTTEILNSMHKEKWNHQIPDNYYCQILFYMAVCEADFAVLKAQLKTVFDGVPYMQTKHYHIERSEVQDDIDYIMEKGAEFWEYVKADKRPPLVLPSI
jgi:putative phage-type endonuclease